MYKITQETHQYVR